MSDFVIYSDSGCDLSQEILDNWGIKHKQLTFRFDGDGKEYANDDMSISEFYNRMRSGGIAKTAAVNVNEFYTGFEEVLSEGKDVLYLGFSSGLSTTYNSARMAAAQLAEKYPERKIITIDTLAASAGEGLLLRLACDKRDEGASIEQTADYVRNMIHRISIWFTVDDLVYLKRGGRVSGVTAFVGNLLGIKPVLHMDDDGHLINVEKVRGRRTAVTTLADRYTELATPTDDNTVYISHADCLADAQALSDLIEERHGVKASIITDVGTVIGAHSGPGTLALFFIGKHR